MKPRFSAFDYALKLLALKDRTEKEISGRLKDKKYSAAETAVAVAKLKEYDYVNDEKFARHYAKNRLATGRSLRLVMAELLKKGVGREILDDVCAGLKPSFEEELKSALGLAAGKVPRRLPPRKSAAKIAGLLSRRGFSWEVISRVIKDLARVEQEDN